MKSDYPARLVSLRQGELFPDLLEIHEEHNHPKKKTLFKQLCLQLG